MLMMAEKRLLRLNAALLMQQLADGAEYEDGKLKVKSHEDKSAA